MRILLVIGGLVVLALPVFAAATTPHLTTLQRTSFTVRGVGFAPREGVRVVATTAGDTATKRTSTGAGGGFTVSLPTFVVDSCSGFVIRAFGATGDRAILHRLPPECPQPPTP